MKAPPCPDCYSWSPKICAAEAAGLSASEITSAEECPCRCHYDRDEPSAE